MKDERIVLRISDQDKKALQELAKKEDIPISEILRKSVKQKLAEYREEECLNALRNGKPLGYIAH